MIDPQTIEKFLENHKHLYESFLFGSLIILLLMFISALINVVRGARYFLVILVTVMTILDLSCYMAWSYFKIVH